MTARIHLEEAIGTANAHLARQRSIHRALALAPVPGGPEETELKALWEHRSAVSRTLGDTLYAWMAQGGTLTLGAPAGAPVVVTSPPPVPLASPATIATPYAVARVSTPQPLATPVAARPTPPPKPATTESLQKLALASLGPKWIEAELPPSQVAAPADIEALAAALGAPPKLTDDAAAHAEAEHLARIAEGCAPWDALPKPVAQAFVACWAARARALQDYADGRPAGVVIRSALEVPFGRITHFSGASRPGAVNGLARGHKPNGTSWAADAECAWERVAFVVATHKIKSPQQALAWLAVTLARTPPISDVDLAQAVTLVLDAEVSDDDPRLIKLLLPRAGVFRVGPVFSKLRKALREAAKPVVEPAIAEPDADLDPAWPHLHLTGGKRVGLVGGDLREDRRQKLADAYQVADLNWVSGNNARQVQSFVERINKGTLDMVWLLASFCSHRVSDPVTAACKAQGVPLVTLRRGYGVQHVRLAMEAQVSHRTATP